MSYRQIVTGVTGLLLLCLAVAWWWTAGVQSAPGPVAEREPVELLEQRIAERRAAQQPARPFPAVPAPVHEPLPEDTDDPARGSVVVDVVDEDGRTQPGTRVSAWGCQVDQHDGTLTADVGQVCTVQAWRRDGVLYARSETVTWTPEPGLQEYLQLEVPTARTGGLGVEVGWDGRAIIVRRVLAGTPAAEQGLEVGDRIIEVDGVPVDQLGLHGFIRQMTGPVGTDVDFVLEIPDEDGPIREALVITRASLDT